MKVISTGGLLALLHTTADIVRNQPTENFDTDECLDAISDLISVLVTAGRVVQIDRALR